MLRLKSAVAFAALVPGVEWQPSVTVHTSFSADGLRPTTVVTPNPAQPLRSWAQYAQDGAVPAASVAWSEAVPLSLPVGSTGPAVLDHNVWFTAHTKTTYSGVPSLVEPAERVEELGTVSVPLERLLASKGAPFEVALVDDMYYREAMRRGLLACANGDMAVFNDPVATLGQGRVTEVSTHAYCLATRIGLTLAVEGLDDPAVAAHAATLQRAHAAALAAGHLPLLAPAEILRNSAVLNRLENDLYIPCATDMPLGANAVAGVRLPADPRSTLMTNLYMSRYSTPAGDLPPHAFVMQDPVSEGKRAPAYGAPALDQVRALLMTALLSHGMRPADFTRVVEAQVARRDNVLASSYLTAVEVASSIATLIATQHDYTSDYALANMEYAAALPPATIALFKNTPPPPHGATTSSLATAVPAAVRAGAQRTMAAGHAASLFAQHVLAAPFAHARTTHLERCHGRHALRSRPVALRDAPAAGPTKAHPLPADVQALEVQGERWSWLGKPQSCGDCEDMATKAVDAVRGMTAALNDVALAPAVGADPLLRAFRAVLNGVQPSMLGGTVSEPFVDTRASTPAAAPPATHQELPRIGSRAADKLFASEGGHGYAALESRVAMARRYLRSIPMGHCHRGDRARLRKHWEGIVRDAAPWAQRMPSLIMEGTGLVNPFLLNAETVYRDTDRADVFTRKSAARVAMVRDLRLKATPAHAILASVVRVETQPYEVRAPAWGADASDAEQYASTFYKFVGHTVTPDTHAASPMRVHGVVCDAEIGTRGVTMPRYLEDSMQPDGGVAIVSPYAHALSDADWAERVQPYSDRVMLQLATTPFLRNSMPAPHQIAQPLSAASLAALAGTPLQRATLMTRLDALAACDRPAAGRAALGAGLETAVSSSAFAILERADASNDTAVLRMYAPAWKFASMSEAQIGEFTGALDAMQRDGRILAHVMTRERAAPYCNDVVRILLALPVPAELDAARFPPRDVPPARE
jgi:hypothetical protein